MTGTLIVCTGRGYTDDGQADGEPCRRRFSKPRPAGVSATDHARAAGWRIGPNGDAMCPACAHPDPATLAAIRQL